jgi:HlyD family secretion protein
MNKRTLWALSSILPLAGLLVYVLLSSGPLAPVPVTVATVEARAIQPALFGVGTLESRYTYRIGPTVAGRIASVGAQVGDYVKAGQVVAEIAPVDLDARLDAQDAALKRARANVQGAEAQSQENQARKSYAEAQAKRYEDLVRAKSVSDEAVAGKRHELQIAAAGLLAAEAGLEAARQELSRLQSEREALAEQRANLRLLTPVDGLVVSRNADPGTTLVAGQAVVEVVDPASLWVHVRFDQLRARGLQAGLPAKVVLRSSGERSGKVLRIEPLADAVTEEILAKVVFDELPEPLPPIGELAEITLALPTLPPAPVVSNASLHYLNGHTGVWRVEDGGVRFVPVRLGRSDLEGRVQILDGLAVGDPVVEYSLRLLSARSRIQVVPQLPGVAP